MADSILAHCDAHLKNLETAHHKINQSIASLTLLSDWVGEHSNCTLSCDGKCMVEGVLGSTIDLLKQTIAFLPEP